MKIKNGQLKDVTEKDLNPDGSFTVPAAVTEIGDFAFFSCKNLTTTMIPEGVTRIASYAFFDCRKLAKITIVGVTEIGSLTFKDCSSLECIYIQAEEEDEYEKVKNQLPQALQERALPVTYLKPANRP